MTENAIVEEPAPSWNIAAAIAGWVLPGLGHFMLGQRKRGVIIGVAIGSLWLAGLLIGGVGGFDRREHTAWFLGQMLIGPSLVVEEARQRWGDPTMSPYSQAPMPYEPSFGRVSEQGILFTALAGLLNLLAILDVLHCDPVGRREFRGEAKAGATRGGAP